MADNKVEVQIGANSSEAKAGISDAVNAVTGACRQMRDSFSGAESGINSSINAIKSSLSSLPGILGTIGTAMVGALSVAAFKRAMDAAVAYNAEVLHLSHTMGMTMESASNMAVALKMIGSSTEAYEEANFKLTRQVKSNEDALNTLGVTTRGTNGDLLSQEQIFKNAVATMMTYKEGADRNLFALNAFGRGAQEAMKFAKLNSDVMAEAAKVAKEYGLVVGSEAAVESKKLSMEMNTMNLVFDAVKIQVGNALIPEVRNLVGQFSSSLPSAINMVVTGAKYLIGAFDLIVAQARNVGVMIVTDFHIIGDTVAAVAKGVMAAAKGDFKGAYEAIKGGAIDLKDDLKTFWDIIVDNTMNSVDRLNKITLGQVKTPGMGAGPEETKGTRTYVEPKTKKEKEEKSRVSDWQAELNQMQVVDGEYHAMSVEKEKQFWANKLAVSTAGTNEYREVQNKIYELIKEEARKKQEQLMYIQGKEEEANSKRMKDAQELAKFKEEQAKQEIETEAKILENQLKLNDEATKEAETAYHHRVEMGEVSAEQELQIGKQLEDSRYSTEVDLLNKLTVLYANQPLKYQEMLDKIQAANQKHNETINKQNRSLEMEQKKAWDSVTGAISKAIDTSAMGIILGTTTMQKAVSNLMQSILSEFIAMEAKKMMLFLGNKAKELWVHLTTEQTKTQATGAGESMRTTLTASAAGESAGAKVASDTAQLEGEAAVGAGGAFSSLASIPYIGPILGAAAAAAALALILGYRSMIHSAAGGWDVDQGGMAMIHSKEMVLPSNLAEGVRDMVSGGGKSSGGGGGVTFNVQAWDTKGVSSFLKQHGNSIADALTGPRRNFRMPSK